MSVMEIAWNDERLAVTSGSRRKANYRALQSWYREVVLRAPYGTDAHGKPIGSSGPPALAEDNRRDHGAYDLDGPAARRGIGELLAQERLRGHLVGFHPGVHDSQDRVPAGLHPGGVQRVGGQVLPDSDRTDGG